MQILQILKLLIQLLPLIVESVKILEAAFPTQGAGSQKLEVLRNTVQGAFSLANDTVLTFEQVWPKIDATVAALVKLLNTGK